MALTDLFGIPLHDPGGRSKPCWPSGSVVTARFSDCQRYRYELHEVWDTSKPVVMFTLMNPSVATVTNADPTLIKTGTFARTWGYGGQFIANVHAYRATDSAKLLEVDDPIGPENDAAILAMGRCAALVVLAFGKPKPPALRTRGPRVAAMLRAAGVKLAYLRLAKCGTPWHPLYLPGDTRPVEYVV